MSTNSIYGSGYIHFETCSNFTPYTEQNMPRCELKDHSLLRCTSIVCKKCSPEQSLNICSFCKFDKSKHK